MREHDRLGPLIAVLREKIRELPARRLKAVRWYLAEIRRLRRDQLLERQRALERERRAVQDALDALEQEVTP